ncbi:uncharacterized protein TrAFT101_006873 [Trichoderma asperellum]|uniref:uncharacterized protein n=1 Tax=Trichoderma asperellum TaxID=101201 RepID=UPI0033166549|nr:hypothetical protein TrAFT101_006873 [Trichoderma asperellum]
MLSVAGFQLTLDLAWLKLQNSSLDPCRIGDDMETSDFSQLCSIGTQVPADGSLAISGIRPLSSYG